MLKKSTSETVFSSHMLSFRSKNMHKYVKYINMYKSTDTIYLRKLLAQFYTFIFLLTWSMQLKNIEGPTTTFSTIRSTKRSTTRSTGTVTIFGCGIRMSLDTLSGDWTAGSPSKKKKKKILSKKNLPGRGGLSGSRKIAPGGISDYPSNPLHQNVHRMVWDPRGWDSKGNVPDWMVYRPKWKNSSRYMIIIHECSLKFSWFIAKDLGRQGTYPLSTLVGGLAVILVMNFWKYE